MHKRAGTIVPPRCQSDAVSYCLAWGAEPVILPVTRFQAVEDQDPLYSDLSVDSLAGLRG